MSSVAVIGLACRLPGAAGSDSFWHLLAEGRDAVTAGPPAPRDPAIGPGGFLDGVDQFDAAFFGISPREARATDPQQRLLLELAWEAFEDAGILPAGVAGSRAGVFVGAIADDYAVLRPPESLTQHSLTGTARGVIANRLSYVYGLRGPSMTVDTAQSSSLVAVHLACESLLRGESSLALAGGVHLNLAARGTEAVARFGALSPDGRCHVFDARANGYVRGEGGGLFVLKRLDDAVADGDRVYCVVRGSAVNNDGASDGLTVPDARSQEEVLRLAYERAGVAPAAVRYVELHGTGTRRGDPVEAAALGAVFGGTDGVLVGSVKTNIGHLEGAAGFAGMVKTVLSIDRGRIPASLNFATPNPDISFEHLRVVTAPIPWPDGEKVAGVSSFGMGGTNCHVVVAEPPPTRELPASQAIPAVPWVVSGRGDAALRAQVAGLSRFAADRSDLGPAEIGAALATTRTLFADRAVVVGTSRDELLAGLEGGDVITGSAGDHGATAVLFSGQGSQYRGMGAELYHAYPVFAGAVDEIFAAMAGGTFLETVRGDSLDQTRHTQTALFAIEVGLFRLAQHFGLRPDFLIGHSIGELAAAHVAGVLSVEDACRLVAARGRLMQQARPGGAMFAVEADEREVRRLIGGDERVAVAAVNGPRTTVVSGDELPVTRVAAALAGTGRRTTRLRVSHAFHSPHMDGVLADFRAVAEGLTYHTPAIPVVANVTGALATAGDLCSPDYWTRQIRETVRFRDGIAFLRAEGVTNYLELGPGGSLASMVRDTVPDATVAGVLRDGRPEPRTFVTGLAKVFVHGTAVDWAAAITARRRVRLPTYPFQRRRYWFDRPDGTGKAESDQVPTLTAPARPAPRPAAPTRDRRSLAQLVRTEVAHILGHEGPDAVDPSLTFADLGFDSLTAVELRDRLAAATGTPDLPPALTFNHPTPNTVVEYLLAAPSGPDTTEVAAAPGEPIAIVGIGCRLPGGVRSPEELWDLVADGREAISGFPTDRGWPAGPAGAAGGFVLDATRFDAGFFGISPREAEAMDPQQRLVLEAAWEAVEHAGTDPSTLRGSRTGVFLGATAQEYGPGLARSAGHALTGTSPSLVSGRVSYFLGLRGPSLTVDTACSSSLVAVHTAVRALRHGDCTAALAGGVTVMATPGMFAEFTRQGGLAADGRCKAFAATADGTNWSEGVGILLLRRLSDARRDGDRVLAVIRGSSVNSDGASNGLTAPSGPAQEQVIRLALADAGLSTSDIDVVEAHGTGTKLGDPIEADALLATYGQDRDRPLWLGSVKSNIGHTQAAAGVAGVIKMIMAMRHGMLPKTLHVDEPTPHVDWSSGAVELLTDPVPWPETEQPRRAGVSSFGISGTNAHVVLEQAPESPAGADSGPDRTAPWVLSARTAPALRDQAARLRAHLLTHPASRTADVAYSLATTRAALSYRAAVPGGSRDDMLAGLDALARGAVTGDRAGTETQPVFVFPGQGSQWPGMATELLDTSPVFAAAMRTCAAALEPLVDWSLFDVLRGPELLRVDVVQPALFAVMVSLAELWRSFGVRPAAVVGHSQGEIAAACVAGAVDLADAARIVVLRSQALAALSGSGGMVSVTLGVDELRPRLNGRLSVAAVNGPSTTVVSGDPAALDELLAALDEDGIRARRVAVDYASHSPHVAAVRERLLRDLRDITPRTASTPFCSTVTGDLVDTRDLDGDYWYRNLRDTVRFEAAVRTLLAQGLTTFVEVSPHPVLGMALRETVEPDGRVTGTLHRDAGGLPRFLDSVAEAHVAGVEVDWRAALAGRRVDLPTYAFQREHHWASSTGVPEDSHHYRVDWQPAALAGSLSGRWLVLRPAGHDVSDCVAALERGGATVVAHAVAPGTDRAALAAELRRLPDGIAGVLSTLAFGPGGTGATLAAVQALGDAAIPARLWCVTRQAVRTSGDDRLVNPGQAQVWGLGRCVALEHSERWGGLVDLPESLDGRAGGLLVTALANTAGEDQLAVRDSGVLTRRVRRVPVPDAAPRWTPGGTVLVTGGTGALGTHLARWLVDHGADRVVLASRGGHAPAGLGAGVVAVACDVADRDALAGLLTELDASGPPLRAVVHAAGQMDRTPVDDLTAERLADVLAPKATGAVNLHELTRDRDLSEFVLFSSIAGLWGSGGNGAYAAANAFLDALAEHRSSLGLPATSMVWGPWAGDGMMSRGGFGETVRRHGVRQLEPAVAVAALRRALDGGDTAPVVVDVDWPRFAVAFTATRPSRLFDDVPEARDAHVPEQETWAHRLDDLPPDQRRAAVAELVAEHVAVVLGHRDPAALDGRIPFRDMGFDSVTAVELRNRLRATTGMSLPVTLLFDYPTLEELVTFLLPSTPESDPVDEMSPDELVRMVLASGSPSATGA